MWGSSLPLSDAGFCRGALASVDLPDEGCPRGSTCFVGMEREEDTESRILDQRSCGGASGEEGCEVVSMVSMGRRNVGEWSLLYQGFRRFNGL